MIGLSGSLLKGCCLSWAYVALSHFENQILVNGATRGYITLSRGIRQGDLLSPALFIICAHALSCLLQKAEVEGQNSWDFS